MTDGPVRVLFADDQPLVRSGLRVIMADHPDPPVVGEAATGAEVVQLVRDVSPDVVVMDIRMPGMDWIEAIRQIMAGPATTRVLVLSADHLRRGRPRPRCAPGRCERLCGQGHGAGRHPRGDPPGRRRRRTDRAGCHTPSDRGLVRPPRGGPERSRRPVEGITGRERELLTLVGRGRSNAEIAEELFVTVATAKPHVSRLLTKLGARDQLQLVVSACEMGLVTPPR